MTRRAAPAALAVLLHGRRIGVITRLAGDRCIFAFEEDYVEDPRRPTLGLGFKTAGGGLLTQIREYRVRVPPFFSNLLPEGHLREYLAARAGVKPQREFFLLHALGADLPGAVTMAPTFDGTTVPDRRHANDARIAPDARAPLRFSLAGVQLKFSAVMEAAGDTVEAWRDHDVKCLLPDHVADAIDRHIEEVAGRMQHA